MLDWMTSKGTVDQDVAGHAPLNSNTAADKNRALLQHICSGEFVEGHRLRSQDLEFMLSADRFHNNCALERLPLISSKHTMEKTMAAFPP